MPAWRSDRCRSVSTIFYCLIGEEVNRVVGGQHRAKFSTYGGGFLRVSSGPLTGPLLHNIPVSTCNQGCANQNKCGGDILKLVTCNL